MTQIVVGTRAPGSYCASLRAAGVWAWKYLLSLSLLEWVNENFTTLEKTVREQAKKKSPKSEAVGQKRAVLTVQVLWGCQAYNATPEEAARRVVADLFEQLSRGGNVPSIFRSRTAGNARWTYRRGSAKAVFVEMSHLEPGLPGRRGSAIPLASWSQRLPAPMKRPSRPKPRRGSQIPAEWAS